MTLERNVLLVVLAASSMGAASACSSDDAKVPLVETHVDAGDDASEGGVADGAPDDASLPDSGSSGSGRCLQALAQRLPARLAVMSGQASAGHGCFSTTDDVFRKIDAHCGQCHSPGAPTAGFSISSARDLTAPPLESACYHSKGEEVLGHIHGDTADRGVCNQAMPPVDSPEGKLWPVRLQTTPNDDIVQLAKLLEAWLQAGSVSTFPCPADNAAAGASVDGGAGTAPVSLYLMSTAVGNGLTNLGSCIPDRALFGQDEMKAAALDARFAAMQRTSCADPTNIDCAERLGLPLYLSETDLTTFDGGELARTGVIGFVPQYPLWSDDAGKLRHVRVPRGQSIRFNKETQEFDIPANTRFYKTFLKRIVDTDGNASWRKIETRLIVARPDPDGSLSSPVLDVNKINALFGSYRWNDEETEATLITQPMKDQEGFVDTVLEYDTDLNLAAGIRDSTTPGEVQEHALQRAGAIRHYAIPGSQRCIHCHMGSPSRSFVLGFRPVQIRHRPPGEGGIIEPSGPDELTQLERLVDLGVITGVASVDDVLPLEDAEGDRKPRNSYELTAQGYMVGNCAHCHNPRGFPTVSFPQLKDLVNFLPGPTGGIFQFPLDRVSPRIKRGIGGDLDIPYITPSLIDNPSHPPQMAADSGDPGVWLPKWFPIAQGQDALFVYAPWRSLIYRNVDTPFTYTDDYAFYPHMPMDTPGYDNRARRILGDWMVSIPATRAQLDVDEFVRPAVSVGDVASDASPQPYVEVKPGDPGYAEAVAEAEGRLAIFHSAKRPDETLRDYNGYSGRYSYRPDTADIIDPDLDGVCRFVPTEHEPFPINVPSHAHWVTLDLTHNATEWSPARRDWQTVLVDGQVPIPQESSCHTDVPPEAKQDDLQHVVNLLHGVTLDQRIRDFAGAPVAMGLWEENPACDWSSEPLRSNALTLDEVRHELSEQSAAVPNWMNGPNGADGQRHVYKQVPGEAVFRMICINCHGPQFDSVGRLAENLATMTGGKAIVADLRHGLFGPSDSPGTNRQNVFGQGTAIAGVPDDQLADNWGARYMPFMALGGTGVTIPTPVLVNVGRTPVFGELRAVLTPPKSANMLSVARELCLGVLKGRFWDAQLHTDYFGTQRNALFLWDNGDAEMWLNLCSINNPPPVVPLVASGSTGSKGPKVEEFEFSTAAVEFTGFVKPEIVADLDYPITFRRDALASPSCTSSGGPCLVGDEKDQVSSLTEGNSTPWCVTNWATEEATAFDAWFNSYCLGPAGTPCVHPPRCPDGLDHLMAQLRAGPPADWDWTANPRWYPSGGWDVFVDAEGTKHYGTLANEWAMRGAINAGLSVFLYLDGVARGALMKPAYDHCEQLK